MSQVPTILPQNCKHLTSHLMVHRVELLVPSIPANKIGVSIFNFDEICKQPDNSGRLRELTVPAADFDERKVLAFKRERPKSQT